uniref:Uncharacterized protein n=1 Tax=Anguilla anguilla TaxID=7936 RepID=A0A0E9TRK0_ANGAN
MYTGPFTLCSCKYSRWFSNSALCTHIIWASFPANLLLSKGC